MQPCLCCVNQSKEWYSTAIGVHILLWEPKAKSNKPHQETIIWRCLPTTSLGEESRLPKCALINNLAAHKPQVDTDAKTNWNLLAPSLPLWIPSDSWDCFCSVRCWGGGGGLGHPVVSLSVVSWLRQHSYVTVACQPPLKDFLGS